MSLYWEIEGSVVAVGLEAITTDSIDIELVTALGRVETERGRSSCGLSVS
jgi:hypothetical protein